jgi:hypothetical protein
MTGTSSLGRTVKLRPFLGVMGMPPDQPGIHSTIRRAPLAATWTVASW